MKFIRSISRVLLRILHVIGKDFKDGGISDNTYDSFKYATNVTVVSLLPDSGLKLKHIVSRSLED